MNEVIKKENIENKIHEIRNVQVILDSDLANLYQCKNGTKDINKAVKRNAKRFPADFYFQLTDEEKNTLRFQIGTTKYNKSRTNPYVFTEQGVAMLASILHTDVAEEVSIAIMRSFVKMRKYFVSTAFNNNNNILINHEDRILKLENVFEEKIKKEENSKIFFEGQIYDAYSLLIDILNSAKEEIVIVDNYAGKELLDILKSIKIEITIVSKNVNDILKLKYESQYDNINFINNNSFHDRFIIIDRIKLYSCGSSFEDLGKKCFAKCENNSKEYLNELLKIIKAT